MNADCGDDHAHHHRAVPTVVATIAREDNIVFAIHVYRASLPLQRRGLMLSRIRSMAVQHGQFVRVRRRDRELDLVMSRDNGFLLGESVHEYFGRPKHMLYCEALPGGRQVMLVVVRDGRIVRDTQLLRRMWLKN